MLKVDIQHFATGDSALFVETTLSNFKEKLNAIKGSTNYPNDNTVYFVSTNYTNGTDFGCPYLLYKGDRMIGNSSLLEVRSNNSVGTFKNDVITDAKHRYISTPVAANVVTVENNSVTHYNCHIYCVNDDECDNKPDTYLPFNDENFYSSLGNLLSNLRVYHTYELNLGINITDTYVLNPDDLTDFNSGTLSNSHENSKIYLNKAYDSGDKKIYTPVARVYRLSEAPNVEGINGKYLFSINFATFLNPIDYNGTDYYLSIDDLTESRITLSGIYSISVFKMAEQPFKLNIHLEPNDYSNSNIVDYVISDNTLDKDNNYYHLVSLNDYNNADNMVDGHRVDLDGRISYGYSLNNTEPEYSNIKQTLYMYELIGSSHSYSSLFRDFTDNYSTIENSYVINVDNITQLSTAIPGITGQMLFVINEFTDRNNNLATGTNMYYWKDAAGGEVAHWQNANILYTNQLKLSDNLTFTDEEIVKLKQLLS